MDAKDLMIGDWVRKGNFIGQVCDIEQRPKDGIIGVGLLDYGYDFYEDTELDPIPLTPEFLEKNFEKKTFYGIYDDYFDLDIREYSDSLYIVTYHSCEFNIPDQTIHVSWVHELQHFMRLCGIDKEIILPKEN